ncbi:hypothetical protein OAI62_00360 [Pelagibacteraceae bacterium]|nr:hypothetical protein [Pelagibacteraceae bacterium]
MIKIHFPYPLIEQTLSKLKSIDNIYLSKKATEYLFVYLKIRFIIQKIDYFFPRKINQRKFAKDVNKKIELLNLEYKKIK